MRGDFRAGEDVAMNRTFDEEYARYLSFLAKLDKTDDIKEKNALFRQLTEQLSKLESRLNSLSFSPELADTANEDSDQSYWI